MGLLLEFFIAFFGVPWLVWKLLSKKAGGSNPAVNLEKYRIERDTFIRRYEATPEEYEKARDIVRAGMNGDPNLQNMIQDDMRFVFGPNTRIFENGKFVPKNERAFGKYSPQGFLHALGYELTIMLLLAKNGKVPPYAQTGSLNHDFQLGFPEEIKFLQRVEQTLHQHGVPAQFILKNKYNYFELRYDAGPDAKKAW